MYDFRASLDSINTVLLVGAHPDDIEIGCGGSILELLMINPAIQFHWVVLTGNAQRRREAREAARRFAGDALGSIAVEGFRERYLPYDPGVKEFFDDLGARIRPDLVVSPWDGDAHQDHRTAGDLVRNTFRDHLILQYEIAKYDGDLGRPSVFMSISREHADQKVERLFDSFPSQADRDWFTADAFMGLMRLRGIECKSGSGFAEAFYARKVLLG